MSNVLRTVVAVVICGIIISLGACSSSTGSEESSPGKKDASEVDAGEKPIPEIKDQPPVEFVDPADYYDGDPGEDVDAMVMDIAGKLWGDTSGMFIIIRDEKYRSEEIWLWALDLEGEGGPLGSGHVRLDLGYVDMFDAYSEFAPKAVGEGEYHPNLAEDALGISELGYVLQRWLSIPGIMVYRKHVQISENRVSVGNFILRYVPDTGAFIGFNRYENEPVDYVVINVDREAALKTAIEYLGGTDDLPTHMGFVQIQDGPSRFTDMHVYWEFKFEAGFVYVRVDDGSIAVSDAGLSEPIIY